VIHASLTFLNERSERVKCMVVLEYLPGNWEQIIKFLIKLIVEKLIEKTFCCQRDNHQIRYELVGNKLYQADDLM